MIWIDPFVCIFAAMLMLILPLDWLLAILFAAVFHEICHVTALWLVNGRIRMIKIQVNGCIMETDVLGYWQQFFGILAGPSGSFALILLCHIAPKVAICGCIQGLFNLLPIWPLDGGRLLQLLLYCFSPRRVSLIMDTAAWITCILFSFLAVLSTFVYSLGLLPLAAAIILIIRTVMRKIPCKPSKIRVQ